MRNITKITSPQILVDRAEEWAQQFAANPNNTNRYRYRHAEIKARLVEETHGKCVYCESKIGHNTPGDTEHKVPTSVKEELRFAWENLTIGCTECNRRKNAYFSGEKPFLDPYLVDVEARLDHFGPIVIWRAGDQAAEITVRILELHNDVRWPLLCRKIEKISEINDLIARIQSTNGDLKEVLRKDLERRTEISEEYSAMVKSLLGRGGAQEAVPGQGPAA